MSNSTERYLVPDGIQKCSRCPECQLTMLQNEKGQAYWMLLRDVLDKPRRRRLLRHAPHRRPHPVPIARHHLQPGPDLPRPIGTEPEFVVLMTPVPELTPPRPGVRILPRGRRCRVDLPQPPRQMMRDHRIPKRRIRRPDPLQLDHP